MTSEADALPTRVGLAEHGENRFRGLAVGAEMAGRTSSWSTLALAVGHATLRQEVAELLDDMLACSLAADPRIWPLKVTRLISSFGRVAPAMAAGILSTGGGFMGWGTYAPAARFLERYAAEQDGSTVLAETLEKYRHVPGFGVAFRAKDERAVAFRSCVASRGFDRGRYWRTLGRAEEELRSRNVQVNIAGVSAAILLDLEFSPEQIDALGPILLLPNYLANAVEGAAQAPAILRTLPADCIDDRTPVPRLSPRAQKAKSPR